MNKKNYFLNLTIILAVIVGLFLYLGGSLSWIIDWASLLFILVLTFPSLLMKYGLKDFGRFHKLAFSRDETDGVIVKKGINFFSSARYNLMATGIVGATASLIIMMGNLQDTSHIGPALATCLITVFYAFLLQLIWVNPLLSALKDKTISLER